MKTKKELFCPVCAHKGLKVTDDITSAGRRRYECPSCGERTVKAIYKQPQILPRTKVSELRKYKRFLCVSAVNDEVVVQGWYKTLKRIAKDINARLVVFPNAYRSDKLIKKGSTTLLKWPEELFPYICNADVQINKNLVFRGKTRIPYTRINPLAGQNHAGDSRSEVYGHPQVALEPVATNQEENPKLMMTTGTMSMANYRNRPSDKKAEFHHSLSALLIEVEGDNFWPHQVHYDGTGAHLFGHYYTPKRKSKGKVAAQIDGDTHEWRLTPKMEKLNNSIASALNVEHRVLNDLYDHYIGSHHARGNVLQSLIYNRDNEFSIRKELDGTVRFLNNIENATVVRANHDEHIDRWFNEFNPRGGDKVNIDLYFELGHMAMLDIQAGGDGNLLRLYVEKYGKTKVTFSDRNKPLFIRGIDCGQHGNLGPNGSRGSAASFSKTGAKTVIGHAHSARIVKGCYQVGASEDKAPYAKGYSSWTVTHCLIYDNGKRGLIYIFGGKVSPLLRQTIKERTPGRRAA